MLLFASQLAVGKERQAGIGGGRLGDSCDVWRRVDELPELLELLAKPVRLGEVQELKASIRARQEEAQEAQEREALIRVRREEGQEPRARWASDGQGRVWK